jgi:hypothetical protein
MEWWGIYPVELEEPVRDRGRFLFLCIHGLSWGSYQFDTSKIIISRDYLIDGCH